ncbi:helix-turn-helix domain-containing protein [Paenibacillus glycanilyticus]|uniref:helix-turn-helix domain-containing protein n=1 Tax=Paenibacillus glycanilyticus TaxID=126569 RepID=UPI00203D4D28|nr:helix-turn-helix domain-containing protein [Paenibacillus glycanilyticus]MCM3627726.1 helix-turn-helix domain-containing protein [Paenibacillus glycanilyticus]
MKKNYFKSKLFLKYIWSYMFILLIPLVLMTIFIYENAVSSLRSEIEQSRLNQLTQAMVIVDGRIKELSEIASRISYDTRLTPYRVHDPIYSGEAIQGLDQYKSTSSMIGELLLYFHKDEKIYSSKGLYDFGVFATSFSFESWPADKLYHDLNSVKYPTMRPADTVVKSSNIAESMLAYLIPITPNSPTPHGTVMYLIRESELTSLIDSILGNYQGLTYILDNEGHILVDNRQGEAMTSSAAKSLINLEPGIHEQTINGKAHSVVSVKSQKNGWTYVTAMPSAQFFSSVLHVRSFIIMLFCIVVLVGAAIALVLARMQYQPISTLVEFAASKRKDNRARGDVPDRGNELDRIRSALQEYSSRIDLQEPFARNHLLSMLLKYGNVHPELQHAFDLRFDRSNHFVAVIGSGDNGGSPTERQERVKLLNQIEFPELLAVGYGVELPQLDQLGIIFSFDLDGEEAEAFNRVREIVEAMRSRLHAISDDIPMIGVGTCYDSPDQLNQSFIEACSAYELRSSAEPGAITYFEKLSDAPQHADWIPNNTLMKLAQSLKQGSYDVAVPIIGSAFQNLQTTPQVSALLTRCICFDLLNTMLKTATELGIHSVALDMAPAAIYGNSLDEIERTFLNLASRICAQVEQNNRKEEHSLMDRIAAYIDERYTDYSLSLESVAFAFSVSPSHVSRSFKEKIGTNFIQYIWQKRLNVVIQQLKTTSDPLKDIILRVGYQDTPNFTRKFKKETGYTPGQYRKLFSENEQARRMSEFEEE